MKETTNKTSTIELFVYKMHIINKKDPSKPSFDKYKASYKGYNFDVSFTEDCRKTFEYEVKEFPINLLVEEGDYFIKRKTYVRNDNSKGYQYVIVIRNYLSFVKTEFETRSIDSVIASLEEEKEGK